MLRLPTDVFFVLNILLAKPSTVHYNAVQWQWRCDRGYLRAYFAVDSRIVVVAHQCGQDEVSLSTIGRTDTMDFHSIQQINEETGTTRLVQRKLKNAGGSMATSGGGISVEVKQSDLRIECLQEETELAAHLIRSLLSLVEEVYSIPACPAERHKCLRAFLRMLYYASSYLKSQSVTSHLAGMLSSQDLKIVVDATKMTHILMLKLPVFGVKLRRQGVMLKAQRLVAEEAAATAVAAEPVTTATSSPALLQVGMFCFYILLAFNHRINCVSGNQFLYLFVCRRRVYQMDCPPMVRLCMWTAQREIFWKWAVWKGAFRYPPLRLLWLMTLSTTAHPPQRRPPRARWN